RTGGPQKALRGWAAACRQGQCRRLRATYFTMRLRATRDREFSRPMRLAARLLLAAAISACAAVPAITIEKRAASTIPAGRPVSPFNLDDLLARGRYLDLQRYLEALPRGEREENPNLALLLGKVRLARGDPRAASEILGRALSRASGFRQRAEIEWVLAQAFL